MARAGLPIVALSLVSVAAASARIGGQPALTPAQLAAPCAALVTPTELEALGRSEVLTQVDMERAGSSTCGWERPGGQGFIVTRQTAEWFAYAGTSGAKQSFDERVAGYDAAGGTERLTGIGLEAVVQKVPSLPALLIRRASDVISVMCTDCTREALVALAKAAAAP